MGRLVFRIQAILILFVLAGLLIIRLNTKEPPATEAHPPLPSPAVETVEGEVSLVDLSDGRLILNDGERETTLVFDGRTAIVEHDTSVPPTSILPGRHVSVRYSRRGHNLWARKVELLTDPPAR